MGKKGGGRPAGRQEVMVTSQVAVRSMRDTSEQVSWVLSGKTGEEMFCSDTNGEKRENQKPKLSEESRVAR